MVISCFTESERVLHLHLGDCFGSEALLRKCSQSKIKIWILVELKWFFFFFFFSFTEIEKQAKNHIRLSHHIGFDLKWNISNQVAFSAYPCKLLRKVSLNHSQVCNLALQHFGLKMSKKIYFSTSPTYLFIHLWGFFLYLTAFLWAVHRQICGTLQQNPHQHNSFWRRRFFCD